MSSPHFPISSIRLLPTISFCLADSYCFPLAPQDRNAYKASPISFSAPMLDDIDRDLEELRDNLESWPD
jgi:hypothetical protein